MHSRRRSYRRKVERRAAKPGVTTRHDDVDYEPKRIRHADGTEEPAFPLKDGSFGTALDRERERLEQTNSLRETEAGFTTAVIELAQHYGWMVAHFRPARTSQGWRTAMQGDPGFPDLVLARSGVVIFAELKTDKGKPTDEQRAWASALSGQVIACDRTEWVFMASGVHIWRPRDWKFIERILGPIGRW